MGGTFTESAWARGWRNAKVGWSDWRFWVAEVTVGGAVATYYHGALAIAVVLAMAIGVWIGATIRAPVRQRNEARAQAAELEAARGKQSERYIDVKLETYCRGEGPAIFVRIIVSNPTQHTVRDVFATVSDIKDESGGRDIAESRAGIIGVPLRLDRTRQPTMPSPEKVDLRPEQQDRFLLGWFPPASADAFFDTVREYIHTNPGGSFYYATEKNKNLPRGGIYEIAIVVRGENVAPVEKSLRVSSLEETVDIQFL